MRDKVNLGFALLLIAMLANAGVLLVNIRRMLANERLVARTLEVRTRLEHLLSVIKDAETGQRGYLLTGDETYLTPYHYAVEDGAGSPRMMRLLDDLQAFTADNEAQQRQIEALREPLRFKLDEMAHTIRLYRQPLTRGRAFAVLRTGRGQKAMEGIRKASDAMHVEEARLLEERNRNSRESADFAYLSLILGAVLTIGLAGLARQLVVREVKRREQAASEARRQREWFEVTLLGIGDGVIATDAHGRVAVMNPVAEALTGWTQAEAIGRPLEEVFRIVNEQTRQPVENPVDRALREGVVVGLANHTILISRDSIERPIEDSGAPIREPGSTRTAGVVLVFRDATQRRAAEAAMRDLDRRKDEFLALLGHELRNPLAPIRNAVEILRLRPDDPAVVALARDTVSRQVTQMSHLVDELLDASRIARGVVQLKRERLDLSALVRAVAEDHRAEFETARLSLSVEVPDVQLWVHGDAARLTQVVGNLLHNACKFTDPGGRVCLSLAAEGAGAALTVEDNGVGIAADALPRLFEAFSQVDASLERSKGGLGLGLSVVRGLIELHGGRVQASSEGLGRGAIFTVWVPLDATGAGGSPEASEPAVPTTERKKILIIEDNHDAAHSLRVLLAMQGYEVTVAHGGVEGVETARRERPQAIVCDLGLPGMSGFEVARTLRADPATASISLVCVTGYGQPDDQRRAGEAGFDLVLVKPFDPKELQRWLARGAG